MTHQPPTGEPPPRLSVGVDIHVGRSRQSKPNQDSLGTYMEHVSDPALLRAKGLLFVVADGMGGAAGGKEASETAVARIIQTYYEDPDTDFQAALERAIQAANTEIGQIGRADPSLHGLGTTLVVALIVGRRLLVANVGDSRVYILRRGRLKQLSLDHTVVQEQLRAGLLSEEEALTHPRRHVLSRNLGSRPTAEPDYVWETLELGDIVLLCSDGLWGPVSEYEIAQLLAHDTQQAAESLIDRANAQGGPDNISAVVVRVDAWGAASDGTTTPITQPLTTEKLRPAAPVTMLLDDEDEPQHAATTQPVTIDTALTQPVAIPPTPPEPRATSTTQRMTPVAATERISTPTAQDEPPPTRHGPSTMRFPVSDAPPPATGASRWLLPGLFSAAILILAVAIFALRPGARGTTGGVLPTAPAGDTTDPALIASVVANETALATVTLIPTSAVPPTVAIIPTEPLPTEPVPTPTADVTVQATVDTSLVPVATVTISPTLAIGTIGGGPSLTPQPTQPATPTAALAPAPAPNQPTPTVDAAAPRPQVVFSGDGTVAYSVGPNDQVLQWNADAEAGTTVPVQTAVAGGIPEPTPIIEQTLVGRYADGNLVRLRLTDNGTILSDTISLGNAASPDAPPDVTFAAFSSDGTQVAYATRDGSVRVRSIEANTEQTLGSTPQTVQRLVWSKDSSKLAVVSDALAVDVWDVATVTPSQFAVTSPVRNVAFGSGDLQLVAVTDNGTITLWLIEGQQQIKTFTDTSAAWTAAALNGNLLALGAENGSVVVWKDVLETAILPTPLNPPASDAVAGLTVAPDGATIAAVSNEGVVRFWVTP